MHTGVVPEVEVLERDVDESSHRGLRDRRFGRGDGEHAPMMVGVGVDVDEGPTRRRADRLDTASVPALGHVHDRFEHRRTLGVTVPRGRAGAVTPMVGAPCRRHP